MYVGSESMTDYGQPLLVELSDVSIVNMAISVAQGNGIVSGGGASHSIGYHMIPPHGGIVYTRLRSCVDAALAVAGSGPLLVATVTHLHVEGCSFSEPGGLTQIALQAPCGMFAENTNVRRRRASNVVACVLPYGAFGDVEWL